MSTSVIKKASQTPPAAVAVNRKPQQGRSVASLERMLSAAEKLMLERGNEDFTLLDVSREGSVSIGSIYLRFESKDSLVRAVIAIENQRIAEDEGRALSAVSRSSSTLAELVPAFVNIYAEILRHHAPLLRVAMERAAHDPLVSGQGKQRARAAAELATKTLLTCQDEFGGRNHMLKARSVHHIIFATLARELSLGSTDESAEHYDWELLKTELGRMCLAYLRADD